MFNQDLRRRIIANSNNPNRTFIILRSSENRFDPLLHLMTHLDNHLFNFQRTERFPRIDRLLRQRTEPSAFSNNETMLNNKVEPPQDLTPTEKQEAIHLILKALEKMGFTKSVQELSQESGVELDPQIILTLKQKISSGKWDDALYLIQNFLVIAPKDLKRTKYLIYKQKIKELVLNSKSQEALLCFQNEVAPNIEPWKIPKISQLLISNSVQNENENENINQNENENIIEKENENEKENEKENENENEKEKIIENQNQNPKKRNKRKKKLENTQDAKNRKINKNKKSSNEKSQVFKYSQEERLKLFEKLLNFFPQSIAVPQNRLFEILQENLQEQKKKLASRHSQFQNLLTPTLVESYPKEITKKFYPTIECLTLKEHSKEIVSLDFSKDGKYLATISKDSPCYIYEINNFTFTKKYKIRSSSSSLINCKFSNYSVYNHLVTLTDDGIVAIWNINQGESFNNFSCINVYQNEVIDYSKNPFIFSIEKWESHFQKNAQNLQNIQSLENAQNIENIQNCENNLYQCKNIYATKAQNSNQTYQTELISNHQKYKNIFNQSNKSIIKREPKCIWLDNDDEYLAISSPKSEEIFIWDINKMEIFFSIKLSGVVIDMIICQKLGLLIVATSNPSTLNKFQISEIKKKSIDKKEKTDLLNEISCISTSEKSRFCLVHFANSKLKSIDLRKKFKKQFEFLSPFSQKDLQKGCYVGDDKFVVKGLNNKIGIWENKRGGNPIKIIEAHDSKVVSIISNPTTSVLIPQMFVSGSSNGEIKVWVSQSLRRILPEDKLEKIQNFDPKKDFNLETDER